MKTPGSWKTDPERYQRIEKLLAGVSNSIETEKDRVAVEMTAALKGAGQKMDAETQISFIRTRIELLDQARETTR